MLIAIIEPHYDDAWLNAGGYILRHPEHSFFILSIARGKVWNTTGETAKLERRFSNIRTHDFSFSDLGWDVRKVRRRMVELGVQSPDALFARLNRFSSIEKLMRRISEYLTGCDALLLPLGLYHPLHQVISRFKFQMPTAKYLEYPYAHVPANRKRLSSMCRGLSEVTVDISQVVKKKVQVFREVYASQRYVLDWPDCARSLESITSEQFFSSAPATADWLRD